MKKLVFDQKIYKKYFTNRNFLKTYEAGRYLSSNSGKTKDILEIRKDLEELLSKKYEPVLGMYTDSLKVEPISQNMADSWANTIIPLSDQKHRLKYINHFNEVRFGRLLEDLDTFAVHLSYNHNMSLKNNQTNSHPLGIVTAFVDKVQIHSKGITADNDLSMQGQVSWVGKSSMEVFMEIKSLNQNILTANFVMVARDPKSNLAARVCGINCNSEHDFKIFNQGKINQEERLNSHKYDLLNSPPKGEESEHIHKLFLSTLDQDKRSFNTRFIDTTNSIWMENCKLKSCIVAMPEHRNIHGKLFGGYVMRKGFELAYANIHIVAKQHCDFYAIDDIAFKAPVEIGSMFLLNSQVAYTEKNIGIVRVYAQVVKPILGETKTTNTFYFLFKTKSGEHLPLIVPKSYGDSLLYIDGQRRFKELQ